MAKTHRNALIAVLLLANLVLVGVVAYQATGNQQLSSQSASLQRDVSSMQQEMAQLRSSISNTTAQNNDLSATIRTLNLTVSSMGAQSGLIDGYLNMQNFTTLISNKTITIWPVISEPPYQVPNMTLVLNFTAEYAGYLVIRSNVTTDAFVMVHTDFSGCNTLSAICVTTFSPSISGYFSEVLPVLPGVVSVQVGSNAPISPQQAWISIDYVT